MASCTGRHFDFMQITRLGVDSLKVESESNHEVLESRVESPSLSVMSYSLYQGQGLARIATIYTGIYMNSELSLIRHVEPSIHDISIYFRADIITYCWL